MSPATRGEVWFADLGEPRDDHEQAGRRPVIIVQTDDLSPLSTVVIIPFTTKTKKASLAHTVPVLAKEAGQERDSVALCAQIRALDRRKLRHKIGELTSERWSDIELAVAFVFGLP